MTDHNIFEYSLQTITLSLVIVTNLLIY